MREKKKKRNKCYTHAPSAHTPRHGHTLTYFSIKGTSQCHWNTFNANGSTSQFASFAGHVPMIECRTPLYRFETIFAVDKILATFWVRKKSSNSFRTNWID